jgi:ABC-2 type transport system ATP-binding protein
VFVHPDKLAAARALHPIAERDGIGHTVMVFDRVDPQRLAALGDVRTPSLVDLFVAVLARQGMPRT